MEADAVRLVLDELDGFVESDLPFDQLTEFILEAALAVRSRPDLTVQEALSQVMDTFRDPEAASSDPVGQSLGQSHSAAAQQWHRAERQKVD